MNGFINVNKPSGVSSAFIVNKVKRKLKGDKCGHMGTLDPLASGVLPIAVGKSTRLFDYLLDKVKVYSATFTFGYETDTLDRGGEVIKEGGRIPSIDEVIEAKKSLTGDVYQLPPLYSAKKVNGVRSYDLARQGIEVQLKKKLVTIIDIQISPSQAINSVEVLITCKGGTYIRSICRDLAYALGTYATMTRLERIQSGEFRIDNSVSVEELVATENIEGYIISPEEVIPFERFDLCIDEYDNLINGRACLVNKEEGKYMVMYNNFLICVGIVEKGYLRSLAFLKD